MAGDVPYLCSLQSPLLANSFPCEFHFLISWINPFLANSHGCELWGLSLNIHFLVISTPVPCKFNSLRIQHPPFKLSSVHTRVSVVKQFSPAAWCWWLAVSSGWGSVRLKCMLVFVPVCIGGRRERCQGCTRACCESYQDCWRHACTEGCLRTAAAAAACRHRYKLDHIQYVLYDRLFVHSRVKCTKSVGRFVLLISPGSYLGLFIMHSICKKTNLFKAAKITVLNITKFQLYQQGSSDKI